MNDADVTDRLIGRLVADGEPVRRLRPPLVRAALWLLGVAAIGAILIFAFSDLATFERRAQDPKLVVELIGTLLTGITAIIAAFYVSLPDRSAAWALLPLPPLVLWIASSGYSCYRHWIVVGPDGWALGESGQCFRFIVAVSVPLGIGLWVVLKRARPLAPLRVASVGGLGVAGVAAFLLQFFHPFDVTFLDLGSHLAAVALVVAVASLAGGRRRAG